MPQAEKAYLILFLSDDYREPEQDESPSGNTPNDIRNEMSTLSRRAMYRSHTVGPALTFTMTTSRFGASVTPNPQEVERSLLAIRTVTVSMLLLLLTSLGLHTDELSADASRWASVGGVDETNPTAAPLPAALLPLPPLANPSRLLILTLTQPITHVRILKLQPRSGLETAHREPNTSWRSTMAISASATLWSSAVCSIPDSIFTTGVVGVAVPSGFSEQMVLSRSMLLQAADQ